MIGPSLEPSTRRADLGLAASLILGCVVFAACADSTAPAASRRVAADAASNNATTSWVNTGNPGPYCLNVTAQDSTTFPIDANGHTGWYYCPYQSSGFSSPDGYASLYLAHDPLNPGFSLTEETISVVRGAIVPTSYNPDGSIATFTETDSLTCDDGGSMAPTWTGTTTQRFVRKASRCCTRFGCRACATDVNVGGTGTLTANQPPPPPPPPPGPPASMVMTPDSATVLVGQTVQLAATVVDSTGTAIPGQTTTWGTSDSTVATVSTSGLVAGVGLGGATITATSDGQSGVAMITVAPEGSEAQARLTGPRPAFAKQKRRM